MSERETGHSKASEADPLQAFFNAEPVPERDVVFRSGVMEAVARRRLRLNLAWQAAAGLVLVVVLMLLAPALEGLLVKLQPALTLPLVLLFGVIALIIAGLHVSRHGLRLPGGLRVV